MLEVGQVRYWIEDKDIVKEGSLFNKFIIVWIFEENGAKANQSIEYKYLDGKYNGGRHLSSFEDMEKNSFLCEKFMTINIGEIRKWHTTNSHVISNVACSNIDRTFKITSKVKDIMYYTYNLDSNIDSYGMSIYHLEQGSFLIKVPCLLCKKSLK